MAVRYIQIVISVHGIEVTKQSYLDYLVGWLREATKAGLIEYQKDGFNFRNDASDIEVDIVEQAGELDE